MIEQVLDELTVALCLEEEDRDKIYEALERVYEAGKERGRELESNYWNP